jgi:hypothetical protein
VRDKENDELKETIVINKYNIHWCCKNAKPLSCCLISTRFVILTCRVSGDFSGRYCVDGVDKSVMVVAHVETRQHTRQTERGKLLFGDSPTASRLGL